MSPLICDTLCLFAYVIKVCMWLFISARVYVVWAHVCTCVWRPEVNLGSSEPCFPLRRVCRFDLGLLLTQLDWLLSLSQASPCLGCSPLYNKLHCLSISPALMPSTLSEAKILFTNHHCWGTLRDAEGSLGWRCTRASSANVNYNLHLTHQLGRQWTAYQSW